MTGAQRAESRAPVLLAPGEGRHYEMGRLRATFKADEAETEARCSISEWWLDPHTKGPGEHSHPEDDVFYILEGTMTMCVGEERIEAPKGSFVLVPGGTSHAFDNCSDAPAGMLNVTCPGPFEPHMPGIAEWFRQRSPEDSAA
jgi:quercetin dioxygenase-like cupin family protein